jgi:hypothetical protein
MLSLKTRQDVIKFLGGRQDLFLTKGGGVAIVSIDAGLVLLLACTTGDEKAPKSFQVSAKQRASETGSYEFRLQLDKTPDDVRLALAELSKVSTDNDLTSREGFEKWLTTQHKHTATLNKFYNSPLFNEWRSKIAINHQRWGAELVKKIKVCEKKKKKNGSVC